MADTKTLRKVRIEMCKLSADMCDVKRRQANGIEQAVAGRVQPKRQTYRCNHVSTRESTGTRSASIIL